MIKKAAAGKGGKKKKGGPKKGKNDMPKIFKGAYKKVKGTYMIKDVQKIMKQRSSHAVVSGRISAKAADDMHIVENLSSRAGMPDKRITTDVPPVYPHTIPNFIPNRPAPSDMFAATNKPAADPATPPAVSEPPPASGGDSNGDQQNQQSL